MSEREAMPYDVVIVGAGPAGLAAAIRLKQINGDLTVCILEKGSEVGAHILSGAVMDPIAIRELMPDFLAQGCPVDTVVTDDKIRLAATDTHGMLTTKLAELAARLTGVLVFGRLMRER